MLAVELCLLVLLSFWTAIFLVVGIKFAGLLRDARHAVRQVQEILETTQSAVQGIALTVNALSESLREVFREQGPPPRSRHKALRRLKS